MSSRRSGELGGLCRMVADTDADEAKSHHEQHEQQDEDQQGHSTPQLDNADHIRNATRSATTPTSARHSRVDPGEKRGTGGPDAQTLLASEQNEPDD